MGVANFFAETLDTGLVGIYSRDMSKTTTAKENDMTTTRRTTISQRKVAAEAGKAYCDTWLGLKAIYTTWEGERLVGTITHWSADGMFPCVTFDDGTWGRLNHEVEIVEESCSACETMTADEIAEAGWCCGSCGEQFTHDEGVHDVQYGTYHEFTCKACYAAESSHA